MSEITPRQTRLRLNKMERWFRQHIDGFTPEDQVFLRLAFEYAQKSGDADVIADALRSGLQQDHPDAKADAAPLEA